MFGRKKVQEAKVTVGDARTVTGNRIVLQPPMGGVGRNSFNLSSQMTIRKMHFTMEDDTILELQVKRKQQELLHQGTRGTLRYKGGKMIDFIPDGT